jgi:Na+/H+ antiporter NhaD/arsenite permease-like protein
MEWKQFAPFVLPLLILAMIGRRTMRAQTAKRIRPERLWIQPLYLGIAMALVLSSAPMPGLWGVLLFAVGAAAGIGVGYLRALHQEFSIEPETGNVMAKGTPVAAILFIGLFVVRYGLNYLMKGDSRVPAHSTQLLLYTDTMMFFAFAMSAASAWEIWRRTRPIIAEHRASTSDGPPAPPASESQGGAG